MIKYFRGSFWVTIIGFIAACLWEHYNHGSIMKALFVVVFLSILEVTLSFDNAVINAVKLEKMNEKAKTLGAVNSLFTCPDGYPNKTQYTTASDMMKISVAAAKNEKIRRTTSKVFVTYTANDGKVLEYTNTNHLIVPSSGNYYEGLFGMKTGTTNAAGQCLIAGCNIYGHEVIITVFKSTNRWDDCKKIIDVTTSAVERTLNVTN